jgi:hypothetical protein
MPTYIVFDQDPEGDFMTVIPTRAFIFGRDYVLPNHIVKQPIEHKLMSFDCFSALAAGDAISTFVVTTRTEDGVITTGLIGTPVINGTTVTMWLSAGIDGLVYPMEMVLTSVLGEVLENDMRIVVREKGY